MRKTGAAHVVKQPKKEIEESLWLFGAVRYPHSRYDAQDQPPDDTKGNTDPGIAHRGTEYPAQNCTHREARQHNDSK